MLTKAVCSLWIASCFFLPQDEQKQEKNGPPRQPGDDVVKPLDKALSDKAKARVEAQSWFMTGKLEQREGRTAKAYEAFQKALDLDPNSVAIYREMIPLAFQMNKPAEAAKLAEKAIELDPEDFEILQQLSMLSASSGRIDEAIGLIERALKSERLKEKSVEAVILNRDLVRLCSSPGPTQDIKRAAKACDVLFAALKDPADFKLDARAQRVLAQQAQLIGSVFAAAGETDKAVELFEDQARVRGDRPGQHNFQLARLYFIQKDYENAEKQLLEFFKTKPRDLMAYRIYVQVLVAQERRDEATENIEKFAKQDSRNAALQYFLADLYVSDKKLDEAETTIKETIRMTGQPAGYLGLAEVYRQKKQAGELLDSLIKAERANIDTGPIVRQLQNDKEMTQKLLDEGNRLLKNDEESLDYGANYLLGRLAAAAEKTDEAVNFLRKAVQLGSAAQVPVVSLELGTQLLFDDQYEEAATVFKNALRNPPRDPQQKQQAVFLYYRKGSKRNKPLSILLTFTALKALTAGTGSQSSC